MKKVAVKDANVFIDLDQMDLLGDWLKTGFETITSNLVMDELRKGGHVAPEAYSRAGLIESVNLGVFEFSELYEEVEPEGLSAADASVLHLALERGALLLTGDGKLRIESEARLIETHGTIWVLEKMIDLGIVSAILAAERLEVLINQSGKKRRYLPRKICEERISKWRE